MDDDFDDFGEFTSTPSVPSEAPNQAANTATVSPSSTPSFSNSQSDTNKCDIETEPNVNEPSDAVSNDSNTSKNVSSVSNAAESEINQSPDTSQSRSGWSAFEEKKEEDVDKDAETSNEPRTKSSPAASKTQQIQHLISKCFQLPDSDYEEVVVNNQIFTMQSSEKYVKGFDSVLTFHHSIIGPNFLSF